MSKKKCDIVFFKKGKSSLWGLPFFAILRNAIYAVEIEVLIPTVTDRVAQMVVKQYLEPILEPHFHRDSYGYRPGKSALQAVGEARKRCWKYHWVLDLDIRSFFDTIDHKLLMRAVRKHTDCKWVLLYVERWLEAPVQMPDGTLKTGGKGSRKEV